eukprot:387826_1
MAFIMMSTARQIQSDRHFVTSKKKFCITHSIGLQQRIGIKHCAKPKHFISHGQAKESGRWKQENTAILSVAHVSDGEVITLKLYTDFDELQFGSLVDADRRALDREIQSILE